MAAPDAGHRVQFRCGVELESEKVAGARQLGPTSGGANLAGQASSRPGCRLWDDPSSLKVSKVNVSRDFWHVSIVVARNAQYVASVASHGVGRDVECDVV